MKLKLADEGKVTGSFSSQFSDGSITEGSFDGETKKLTLAIDTDRMSMDITAALEESKLTGSVDVGDGMFTYAFEAQRKEPGEGAKKEEEDSYDWKPLTELLPGPLWVSSIS